MNDHKDRHGNARDQVHKIPSPPNDRTDNSLPGKNQSACNAYGQKPHRNITKQLIVAEVALATSHPVSPAVPDHWKEHGNPQRGVQQDVELVERGERKQKNRQACDSLIEQQTAGEPGQ